MTHHPSPAHMLSWLENPPEQHISFSDGRGTSTAHTYAAVALGARRNSLLLRRAGIGSGDVVLVPGQNTLGFVTSLYGVLHAGATPAIIAPVGPAALPGRLRDVIGAVGPAALLATRDHASFLAGIAGQEGCEVLVEADEGPASEAAPEPPEVALIQFSSGSRGDPRGIQIAWPALNTHIDGIRRWLSTTADSHVAGWIPFYHDMGLVGTLLHPLAAGCGASFMPPQEFIGDPLRWLRLLSSSGATESAVPAFSLNHVTRRVRQEQLEGLDFSRLESLVIGAERIDPNVLDAFHALLAPHGLSHGALLPAYGLAEAVLAVTGVRPDPHEVHTLLVDVGVLEVGKPVSAPASDSTTGTRLVSCGGTLDEVDVDILDTDGSPLSEGVFGEIAVRGKALATGYLQRGLTAFDGRHRTGDMGFTRDGELYVVGRAGDGIKVNGRWLFAEDVQILAAEASPKPQRTVALLGAMSGGDTAVVVMEDCTAEETSAVGRFVAARLPGTRVLALLVPRGGLRRTTSGKPRRGAMWRELVMSGDLPASGLVWDSHGAWKEQVTSR
ncbi:AMP-binding protein [Streptomyces sp. WSLK1-5]|uniref:AMP-binding protein n=1 Tax=unclassified Streptomyces TaxID=2593676 RepID=UPI0037A464FD